MTDQIKPATPDLDEVASWARDVTFPVYSGVFRELDDTLIARGQGKGLKLYDEIERDCVVYGDLQKRKQAVISRPWQVDPASSSRLDKKAADIVRAQLSSEALNFDLVCLNLLDAILKGFAVGEVMWGYDGSQIVVTKIMPRNQLRFNFGDDYRLRLKVLENFIPGIELPDRKFIVHSFGAKDGTPHGLGLGTRLFWPAFFKRKDITFWLALLDKFASPTPVGEYPNGASTAEQSTLLNALDALSQSSGVIIPQGMTIKFLEASRSGQAGYENFCRYMDEQITFTILGESPISKGSGSGGQAASAAITRNEVRLELVQADSDLLSATLNSTLVKWITEYNVPGATPPRVWRKVEAQKDLGAVATRDLNICSMGFKPTLAYIIETYGGEWVEAPQPAVKGTPDNAGGHGGMDAANFADPAAPTTANSLSDQTNTDSAAAWNAVMTHVTDLVDKADSLQSLQDALTQAYGGLPLDDLRKIMAQAFQVAALSGMADVADGN